MPVFYFILFPLLQLFIQQRLFWVGFTQKSQFNFLIFFLIWIVTESMTACIPFIKLWIK